MTDSHATDETTSGDRTALIRALARVSSIVGGRPTKKQYQTHCREIDPPVIVIRTRLGSTPDWESSLETVSASSDAEGSLSETTVKDINDTDSEVAQDGDVEVVESDDGNLDVAWVNLSNAGVGSERSRASVRDRPDRAGSDKRSSAITPAHEESVCPECETTAQVEGTEYVCPACGLIVTTDRVDPGPEWRFVGADEGNTGPMRRCNGAPSTVSLHDNGLGSTIRYSDTSKKSNTTQLRRMRTWHRRARIKNKKERNLKEGLSQVRAVTGRLSLGAAVRDRAAAIFRKGHMDHSLTCGRSIEQIAGAAVYAATRELNLGRRPEEIAKVLRLFESDLDGEMDVVDAVRSGYSCLCRDLELTIAPPSPVEYIPKTASRLKMSEETYHRALSIAQTVEGTQEIVGKAPSGVAGACLFLGSQATGEYVNQGEIARQVNRSTPAVRSSAESIAPIVVEQGLLTPKMVGEKSAVGKALVNAGYSLEESDGANSHNEQSTDEDASARPELTLPRATAVAESNGMGGKNTHLAD